MTNPSIVGNPPEESQAPPTKPVEERLQKLVDKALYSGGSATAQKIRNFLNGTWLGEPLHIVLTDVPVGAWTVAMVFDALDLIRSRREFELAADTSIAIGLAGAIGAAITGVTDWSDVDPPARRIGLIHGLLNVGATALFTTSLVLRKKKSRTPGRISAALGYAVVSYAAHLGGTMVYEHRVGVDQTDGEVFRKSLWRFCAGDSGGPFDLYVRSTETTRNCQTRQRFEHGRRRLTGMRDSHCDANRIGYSAADCELNLVSGILHRWFKSTNVVQPSR